MLGLFVVGSITIHQVIWLQEVEIPIKVHTETMSTDFGFGDYNSFHVLFDQRKLSTKDWSKNASVVNLYGLLLTEIQ